MCNVAMVLTGQNIYSVRAVQIMRSGRGGGGSVLLDRET